MILAAGLGTRLRPLTGHTPKALVQVNGMSLLELQLCGLKHLRFDRVVVNVHHHADEVQVFLDTACVQHNNSGLHSIHVSDERDQLLETGGAILKARHLFNDQCFYV